MAEVPFGAHGYGSYFSLSLLDRWVHEPVRIRTSINDHIWSYHNPNATIDEGLATLKRCIDEVSKRLVVAPSNYKVKIVDKDGVRDIQLWSIFLMVVGPSCICLPLSNIINALRWRFITLFVTIKLGIYPSLHCFRLVECKSQWFHCSDLRQVWWFCNHLTLWCVA